MTKVEQIAPVVEGWLQSRNASQPLTITPLEDGKSFMFQVGGRSEMTTKELIEFLGVTRHAWLTKYRHLIRRNRNGKYGIRSAMDLKRRICGEAC